VKITVTTTSQTLATILSAAQETQLSAASGKAQNPNMVIQNQGLNNVFAAFGAAAVVGECLLIPPNGSINVIARNLGSVNLIADGGSNTNVVVEASNGEVSLGNLTEVNLEAGDLQIGAVEVKNSSDDTRATVTARGLQVEAAGAVAAGAADSGNPVKVGGKYNVTPPTLDDGDRGDAQLNALGALLADLQTRITGEDFNLNLLRVAGYGVATNLTASGLVKTGAGIVLGVYVASTSSGTFKLWDNTAGSGTVVVNTTTPAAGGVFIPIGAAFSTGLYCTIGSTIDLTVITI